MILDVLCLAAVLLFLVAGVISGFLRQAVRLAAFLGAFLLLSPVAGAIRGLLARRMDVDGFPGHFLVLGLGWLAGYLLLLLAGMLVLRAVRAATSSIRVPDRILGGALGALKGGLIVFGAVTALLLFDEPIGKFLPEFAQEMKTSRVAAALRGNNPLLEWMQGVESRVREMDVGLPS